MRVKLRAGAGALALCLCLVVGCGGKTSVKGKVTHKGKPLVWGTVTLVDQSGHHHQGPIDLNGDYTIPSVPTGPVKIGVHSNNPASTRERPKLGAAGGDPSDPRSKFKSEPVAELPRPEPGKWFPIPSQASDPYTSGLTGEVRSGKPLDVDVP